MVTWHNLVEQLVNVRNVGYLKSYVNFKVHDVRVRANAKSLE